MKNLIAFSLALLVFVSATQAGSRNGSRIGAGARYHPGHDTEMALPYDNDTSYGIVYEYHEGDAYWQFAVSYADSMGSNEVDYVITPEINLLLSDNMWRGGMGVLAGYVESGATSDWSDVFYQFVLGFQIPVGPLSMDILAYYVFDDFGEIGEFEFDELEVGAWLTYKF